MEAHVMKFLKKDKNIKFIPKTGKSILMKYDGVTKSMSQDSENTVFHLPSMIYNTMAYIINYSTIKG